MADDVAELWSEVPAYIPLAGKYGEEGGNTPWKAIQECSDAEIMRYVDAIIVKERELKALRENLVRYLNTPGGGR